MLRIEAKVPGDIMKTSFRTSGIRRISFPEADTTLSASLIGLCSTLYHLHHELAFPVNGKLKASLYHIQNVEENRFSTTWY